MKGGFKMLSMLEIILLCITVFILVILSYSYIKDREWENFSLLLIKTILFILTYIVVKHY